MFGNCLNTICVTQKALSCWGVIWEFILLDELATCEPDRGGSFLSLGWNGEQLRNEENWDHIPLWFWGKALKNSEWGSGTAEEDTGVRETLGKWLEWDKDMESDPYLSVTDLLLGSLRPQHPGSIPVSLLGLHHPVTARIWSGWLHQKPLYSWCPFLVLVHPLTPAW